MRIALLLLLVLLSVTGCGSKTKENLYEEGVKQLKAANPAGAVVYFKNALEKDANFYDARLQLAKAYASLGKNEQAEKEYTKVLTQNPSHDEVQLELARLFNVMGKGEQGHAMAGKYLSGHPGDAEGLEALGTSYAVRGKNEEALDLLQRAVAAKPGRPEARLQLASVHLALGQVEKARSQLGEVVAADPKNLKAAFMLAALELKTGNLDRASSWYQKILQLDPARTDARYKLGLIQVEKGELERADGTADEMLKQYPKKGEGYRLKGVVSFYKKKYDDAITNLMQAVKLAPTLDGYQFLGLSYYNKGELENALSQFRVIVDRLPSSRQARLMIAQTLLAQKRVDDGIAEVKKVIAADDSDALAHSLLGSAYLQQGLYEEGMRELDHATRLDPKLVQAHLKKGAFYFSKGKAAQGESELALAVQAAPDALNSRLLLASYYQQQGRRDKAFSLLNSGLTGGKQDAPLYNALAGVQFAAADKAGALKSLAQAKRVDPLFPATYHNLTGYYAAAGDYQKAMAELSELATRAPGNVRALLGLAALSDLTGRDADALQYYKKAQGTRAPEAYLAFSAYYQKKGAPDQALAVLDEAAKLDPRALAPLEEKGRLFMAQKEYKKALEVYDGIEAFNPDRGVMLKVAALVASRQRGKAVEQAGKLVARHPDSPQGHLVLAGVYQGTGDARSAFAEAEKAARIAPKSAEPRVVLGDLYRAANDPARAMGSYQEALKVQPESLPAQLAVANLLEATGKKQEAAARYRAILGHNSRFLPALNNLAYLSADGYGSKEEALKLAMAAFRQEPGNASVMDTVGYALYRNGRGADAVQVLTRAASLMPRDPTVRYHLGLAYNQAGDRNKSKQALKESLALGDYPDKKAAQTLLAQLQ